MEEQFWFVSETSYPGTISFVSETSSNPAIWWSGISNWLPAQDCSGPFLTKEDAFAFLEAILGKKLEPRGPYNGEEWGVEGGWKRYRFQRMGVRAQVHLHYGYAGNDSSPWFVGALRPPGHASMAFVTGGNVSVSLTMPSGVAVTATSTSTTVKLVCIVNAD